MKYFKEKIEDCLKDQEVDLEKGLSDSEVKARSEK